jgi:hypothetical protein
VGISRTLFVDVEVPAEVGLDGLIEDVDDIGTAHGHMVLEAVLADVSLGPGPSDR